MRLDADRSHAGAAAAMRNAERLVQIEMADVGAVIAGPRQADLRVHVGAVEIDLAAMAVHDVADLADVLLEHAMRRGIGDHDGGEVFGVLLRLGAEIVDVDIAARVAGDHHHLHADHAGGGRIGAVRRGGDQADLAMRLAARGVIAADRQQAGIFALRAGIRLQRDRVIAGDVAQPLLRAARTARDSPWPARRGANGCRLPNSGQVSGIISAVALSFMVQEPSGIIARSSARSRSRELAHVAQQLGLGAVGVEHRMGQERAWRVSVRPAAPRARRLRRRRKRACRRTRARPLRRSQASWSRRARCRARRSPTCAD